MTRSARTRTTLIRGSLALLMAATGAATTYAQSGDRTVALESLSALSRDLAAPVSPELTAFGFEEATYLVDGLTLNELRRLRFAVDRGDVKLPANIAGAIRAKTPNQGLSRRN